LEVCVIKKLLDVKNITPLELVKSVKKINFRLIMDYAFQKYLSIKLVNIHGSHPIMEIVEFLDVKIIVILVVYNANLDLDFSQMVFVNKDLLKDVIFMP
jgi:hypothetical protein